MDHEPGGMTLSEEDRRLVGLWAADCAERVLPLFEAKALSDTRPRAAIEGIRAFARGEKRKGQLRSPRLGGLRSGTRGRRSGCRSRRSRRGPRSGNPLRPRTDNT